MKLIRNYLSMSLKTELEYKVSFILTMISQVIVMLIDLFTVYALFDKFTLLDIYDINELLLGFSTIWLSYSLAETFFHGIKNFSDIIVNGDFDILLIRPRNLFIQIFGSDIDYSKLSRSLVALGLYIYASIKVIEVFTISKIILLILMIMGSIITILALFILGASCSFITIQGLEAVYVFTHGTRQVGEYPITIYNKAMRIIFTFVIPIALMNYYPIEYLKDKSNSLIYLLMPFISLIPFFISIYVFKLGVRKYSSTGS